MNKSIIYHGYISANSMRYKADFIYCFKSSDLPFNAYNYLAKYNLLIASNENILLCERDFLVLSVFIIYRC